MFLERNLGKITKRIPWDPITRRQMQGNMKALTFKVRVFHSFAADHQALPPTRQLEAPAVGTTA